MILTFYDLETTGLDKDTCDIIQVAYACYNTTTEKIVKSNAFYLWEDNFTWTESAYKVHQLSQDFLRSLPKEEMPMKYQEMFAVFNRADTIGYNNIGYDDVVLQNFMRRHSQPIAIDSQQDVRDMARSYFKGSAGHLEDLPKRIGLVPAVVTCYQNILFKNKTHAHDATYDVASTFVCYKTLIERKMRGV